MKWYEKIESLAAKHKVKVIGVWNDHLAHAIYAVFETPSMDAFMDLMMEPECMGPLAFCTAEIKPVFDANMTLMMLKSAD